MAKSFRWLLFLIAYYMAGCASGSNFNPLTGSFTFNGSSNTGAGGPTQLAFLVQPGTVATGATLSPAIQVALEDANGNVLTNATTTITLVLGNAGSATLSGTLTAATVNGVATFSDLSVNRAGTSYVLAAAAPSLGLGQLSTPFNVAAQPAKLQFSVQPSNSAQGQTINPAVQVSVVDANNVVVQGASNSITLAIGANPGGGTLAGTKTVAAVNGVATFSDLSINAVGTGYTLQATSNGLQSATSNSFNEAAAAGVPNKLAFLVQPSTATAGGRITPAVVVVVQDVNGTTVGTASNSVTLAIGTNPGSSTLSGTVTVNAVNGAATFSNLSLDKPGTGYTLTASSGGGITSATSTTFTINPLTLIRPAVSFLASRGFSTFQDAAPFSVAAADFNGDGKMDYVSGAGVNTKDPVVYLNTTPASSTDASFSATTIVGRSLGATRVTTGDFNGDGKPDLATATSGLQPIAVQINTTANAATTPSFSAPVLVTVTTNPVVQLAVADVNGDGKQDVLCQGDSLTVLINTSPNGTNTPTFVATAIAFPGGPFPFAPSLDLAHGGLAVGDFNGDGKVDAAVAGDQAIIGVGGFNDILLLSNTTANGASTPTYTSSFVGTSTGALEVWSGMAAADIDGDGKLDLVSANQSTVGSTSSNEFSVYLGNGLGGFGARNDFFNVGLGPMDVKVADFNSDGKPDVVVANTSRGGGKSSDNQNSCSVFLNTGSTGVVSFATPLNIPTTQRPGQLAVADMNGDGKADVIAASDFSFSTLSDVLINTTPAQANTASFLGGAFFSTDKGPSAVLSVDLNGDSKLDVVSANGVVTDPISPVNPVVAPANNLTVLMNGGGTSPTFTRAEVAVGQGPVALASADLNADGKMDVVSVNAVSGTMSLLLNQTTAGSATPTLAASTVNVGSQPFSVTTGDFNADGKPDLAVTLGGSNQVAVYLNQTTAGANTPTLAAPLLLQIAGHKPTGIASGDLNADGKVDLAVGTDEQAVLVFPNTTAQNAATASFDVSQYAAFTFPGGNNSSIAIADLNGDGKLDIGAAGTASSAVNLSVNTTPPGGATFSFTTTNMALGTGSQVFTNYANAFRLQDVNGDGVPDFVYVDSINNAILVMRNATSPGSAGLTIDSPQWFLGGDGVAGISVGDVNGDGKADLVAGNSLSINSSVTLMYQR